jgi:hypothetical protein
MEVLTRQGPVLMIFEDARWIDLTILELFGRVVDRIQTLRVLLIAARSLRAESRQMRKSRSKRKCFSHSRCIASPGV